MDTAPTIPSDIDHAAPESTPPDAPRETPISDSELGVSTPMRCRPNSESEMHPDKLTKLVAVVREICSYAGLSIQITPTEFPRCAVGCIARLPIRCSGGAWSGNRSRLK